MRQVIPNFIRGWLYWERSYWNMRLGKEFEFNRMEFAGSLGDVATFLPIFIGLCVINGLNPGIGLCFAGLFYIFSSLYYKIPMPVQPLKALGAIAIASGLSFSLVQAAGMLMGITLLFLAMSNLCNFLSKIFTKPIIRGIQFGVGLMLIETSVKLMYQPIRTNSPSAFSFNLFVIIISSLIMLVLLLKRLPASCGILNFGIMVSLIQGNSLSLSFSPPSGINLFFPNLSELSKTFFLLFIPQLPLTLGNAVVSTKDLAERYFKKEISHSAYYSLSLFSLIPHSILGIMLIYTGFRHCLLITDLKKKELFLAFIIRCLWGKGKGRGCLSGNRDLPLCLR
ncbi:MAG: putative sulfate/molybdate transporter [bacterium]